MFQSPKSLTATIHVKFHYKEPEVQGVTEGDIQLINRILDRASELSPEFQQLLVKFAAYLENLESETKG